MQPDGGLLEVVKESVRSVGFSPRAFFFGVMASPDGENPGVCRLRRRGKLTKEG